MCGYFDQFAMEFQKIFQLSFQAGLWDRHHGVQVCEFDKHKDVINSVAVNPVDESVAITVSSDMQVLLWKSKSAK